jgi:hypothetical protein
MTIIHLVGRITEAGQLEVTLPAGLPPGKARVTVEIASSEIAVDDEAWSDEELDELLRDKHPMTGKEIIESGLLIGGLENEGITDSVAWVEEQRRKRSDQFRW